MRKTVLAMLVSAFALEVFAAQYKLDSSHLDVGFSVKHMMISNVKGHFSKVDGSFNFDEKKGELSKVVINIDPASIDTSDVKRNEHLQSPDFFDVKKYTTMTYKGDKVDYKDGKPVKIHGHLTMHGVTKPVDLDVEYKGSIVDPYGNQKVGFSLSGELNRQDFGLKWQKPLDKGLGVAVGDQVKITIDGEAQEVKEAAKK